MSSNLLWLRWTIVRTLPCLPRFLWRIQGQKTRNIVGKGIPGKLGYVELKTVYFLLILYHRVSMDRASSFSCLTSRNMLVLGGHKRGPRFFQQASLFLPAVNHTWTTIFVSLVSQFPGSVAWKILSFSARELWSRCFHLQENYDVDASPDPWLMRMQDYVLHHLSFCLISSICIFIIWTASVMPVLTVHVCWSYRIFCNSVSSFLYRPSFLQPGLVFIMFFFQTM